MHQRGRRDRVIRHTRVVARVERVGVRYHQLRVAVIYHKGRTNYGHNVSILRTFLDQYVHYCNFQHPIQKAHLTGLGGYVHTPVDIVVDHPVVVVPEDVQRGLVALDDPAREPQRRTRLQILLRGAKNLRFRFCKVQHYRLVRKPPLEILPTSPFPLTDNVQLDKYRRRWMRRDLALVQAGVPELDVFDLEWPLLWSERLRGQIGN